MDASGSDTTANGYLFEHENLLYKRPLIHILDIYHEGYNPI